MRYTNKLLLTAVAGLGLAFNAAATDIPTLITTDTVYTAAQNPLFLKGPTLVSNGASLTFGPGCIVVTLVSDDGGLVVTRGSQIFVNGTEAAPVIMTSGEDVATWTGTTVTRGNVEFNGTIGIQAEETNVITSITNLGDPTTGTHREVHQEWRNLTIMGNAVISATVTGSSSGTASTRNDPDDGLPNPTIVDGTASALMEGLNSGDEQGQGINARTYGQGDDNDDSGSVSYLSVRYTGRVLGAGNELNGLSLGGLGRETDIHHVDIMNNVDDGIEIWGGTVNIKYFKVWNIGDDSFDVDQGWRGKAQFGLLVQGYAASAANGSTDQGSGAGDNIFEADGAESSDIQPRTTSTIYNVTAIGMTNGDGATAWRDNARVQYRNMMFIDIGEELVRADGDGGEGTGNYGKSGTHSFISIWSTPASTLPTINQGGGAYSPANLYTVQVDGNLAEIKDSVVYDPDGLSDTGDTVFALGILEGSTGSPNSSGANANVYSSVLPIAVYNRTGTSSVINGKTYTNVALAGLDPRPVIAAAKESVGTAPADGFFTPAPYRGGFSPDKNWAEGWTAADAFGFFANTGANPADPGSATLTLAAKLNFPTEAGKFYTVFESADGVNYSPIATVKGTGGTMSVADVEDFDSSKLYKVEAQ